jgi:hypothetical protein
VSEPDLDTARWLVSADGLDVLAEVTRRLDAGDDELAITTRLRREGHDPSRTSAVVAAGVARRRAREDRTDADRLVLTREALEQASHPQVARWRARRFAAERAWDLCAGIGADAIALGTVARELTVVERDPGRAVLLEHNLGVHDIAARCLTADALQVTVGDADLVHVDPARRRDGRRVNRLEDHVPAVPALLARHAGAAGIGVVVSPGVDLTDPDLPDAEDVELEFVQVDDRLVEAVVWVGALRTADASATATLLPAGVTRTRSGSRRPAKLPVGEVGEVLVEVAPAAVRARLHDDLGRELGARRIASRRALLTVDEQPDASPWYHAREVLTVLPAHAKAVRRWLRTSDDGPIELVFHGLSAEVDRWWRELGRPPRGPDGVRIELVRLDRGATAIVTRAGGRPPRT